MRNKLRESNMELLRILAMVFIVIFHYIYKSNFQYTELTVNNLFIKSGWFLGELGVNLFMLITGYYLCKSKTSIKKIIILILEVWFYNFLNCFIDYQMGNKEIFDDLTMFFPIITGRYWFITAYLLIYGLSNYFNKLISMFKKRDYQKFLFINLLFWCFIPTVFGLFYNSSESLPFYNRFIWLSVVYFIGAYIRIYNIKFFNSKVKSLIVSGLTFILMLLSIIFIDSFKDIFREIGTRETAYFWTTNNLLMVILSISIFMFFRNLNIKSNTVINTVSSTTLGVYLLHDGILNRRIWLDLFKNDIFIYNSYWYFYVIMATVIIFGLGVIIDLLRQLLEKITVKKIINFNIWPNLYYKVKKKGLKIIDKLF